MTPSILKSAKVDALGDIVGFLPGLSGPLIRIKVSLEFHGQVLKANRRLSASRRLAEIVFTTAAALLNQAQMDMPGMGRINSVGAAHFELVFVSLIPEHRAVVETVRLVLKQHLAGQSLADTVWRQNAVNAITARVGNASNPRNFLFAARDLDLPVYNTHSGLLIIGQGAKARWLSSAFTDQTPTIATSLARDKLACSGLLRVAGLPVPDGRLVTSEEDAVAAAQGFGLPVVVKPANLDGGVGVSCGLESFEEVITAYRKARVHSKLVLLERHIAGNDYRITTYRGEVVSAIERVPGGLTGDGRSTVQALLERFNSEPGRGTQATAKLSTLVWDDEAEMMLGRAGLTLQSIPADGQFVRLRRAANFALGGTVRGARDRIHPDNRALAQTISQLLRLDVAGIDLITPDISRSWLEMGGAVCEVNASPYLGQRVPLDLFSLILQDMFADGGRIPVIAVWGRESLPGLADMISRLAVQAQHRIGIADSAGIMVNGTVRSQIPSSPLQRGRALVLAPDVDAILWFAGNDTQVDVMPFDRIDLLLCFSSPPEPLANLAKQQVAMQGETTASLASRFTAIFSASGKP